jgi:uncharacterized protein (UPF0333 family)
VRFLSKALARIHVVTLLAIIVVAVVSVGGYYFSQGFSSTPQTSTMPVPVVETSRNWAGYVVASDLQNPQPTVTSISAFWTVPTVVISSNDTFSAVWIGIGGFLNNHLF